MGDIVSNWSVELPPENRAPGDSGHAEDHNALRGAIVELREQVDSAEKTATWGQVANRPKVFPVADIEPDESVGLIGGTLQEVLENLASRIAALESGTSTE